MAKRVVSNLGSVTAYGFAKKYGGYTGTAEDFGRDQAGFADNAQIVRDLSDQAALDREGLDRDYETYTESLRRSYDDYINTVHADTETVEADIVKAKEYIDLTRAQFIIENNRLYMKPYKERVFTTANNRLYIKVR